MRKNISMSALAAAAVIAAGLLVGCEKTETTSTPTTKVPTPSMPVPSAPSTSPAASALDDAADKAKSGIDSLIKPVGDKPAIPPATTDAPAAAGDAESIGKAQTLLTQATQYIKENKVDLAEKAITQLDALKPKLPAEYQPKIDAIHSALDTLKKGNGLKDSLKNGLIGK